jgi:hypothetical protein
MHRVRQHDDGGAVARSQPIAIHQGIASDYGIAGSYNSMMR